MRCVDVNTHNLLASQGFQLSLVMVSLYRCVALTSPDQVSLEHQSEIHCLFNNGQQDANKLKIKATNKLAIKSQGGKEKQMQCSSFGRLLFVIKRLFSYSKKKNQYQDWKLDWLKSESKCWHSEVHKSTLTFLHCSH